jgi:hypothetical protein
MFTTVRSRMIISCAHSTRARLTPRRLGPAGRGKWALVTDRVAEEMDTRFLPDVLPWGAGCREPAARADCSPPRSRRAILDPEEASVMNYTEDASVLQADI